jgi:putative transcriptional regulator
MSLNETVKIVRNELKITQEKLAHDLHISFSTINRWENGKNSLSKLAKLRLIEYCEVKGVRIEIINKLREL